MITIKDVAKEANVSIGTVSNVLNGKTNNLELITRVENAIRILGYVPDAKAQALKRSESKMIGLIIDSIDSENTGTFISSIESNVIRENFTLIIKSTNNNKTLEKKYVDHFLQLGVDGIIVYTMNEPKKWISRTIKQGIPVVTIQGGGQLHPSLDIIKLNYQNAINQSLEWAKSKNLHFVGAILSQDISDLAELKKMAHEHSMSIYPYYIDKKQSELGFKSTFELLYRHPEIDVLLVGSNKIFEGASKAISMLNKTEKIKLIVIKNENWIQDDGKIDAIIDLSHYQLGSTASKRILDKIKGNIKEITKITEISASFKVVNSISYCVTNKKYNKKVLNVALLKNDSAHSLILLQHLFTEKSGIFINFKQYGYGELKSLCLSQERILKEEIDIVMFDISWLNQLEEVNLLHDLDDVISQEYLSSYVEGIDQHYRGNSGKLLGLPLLTGTQLLFYQKDLFQDSSLKIMYQRMFGEELKVPNNWTDYNKIAKFFTKQFNEKSPVKYGTAMIKSGNLYNTIEYLNRLWAFGGDIQNGSQTTLTNEVARYALQNYHEIAQFTPDYCESWEDMATYFKKGEIAMVILYDSFAYGLNSAMESHVSGNIGSNIIPGKSPVLGGWGLGITKQSVNFEAAIEFEKWACSQEIDKPFSVLTGVSSHRDFYLNSELSSMYPWKDKLLPSFKLSRVRPILKNNKLKLNSITFYEQLGSQLNQFLNDEISGKELLKKWKEY